MFELLKKLKEEKRLAAIYTDINTPDSFRVGYISAVNEEEVLLLQLGLGGGFDGYTVFLTEDVFRVETDSLYLNKIERLAKIKGTRINDIFSEGTPMEAVVEYARQNRRIAAFSLDEDADEITGYIDSVDSEKLFITQISQYGQEDGKTVLFKKNILAVCVGDEICADTELLNKNQ